MYFVEGYYNIGEGDCQGVNNYFSSTNWNLSNTDDLSYFLSIIVAVVYGKFAVIQFWQNL